MRTYLDIINDYLEWKAAKLNDDIYLPSTYLSGDDAEVNLRKAIAWKEILDLSYKEKEGIYYFTKFILGDLTYAGYPTPIKFNNLWWEWAKLCKTSDHLAVKCARQHGKSTFWTVIQSIYRTSLFTNYNVLISSASEDQAVMLMGFLVRVIMNNEFLDSKRSPSAKWSTTEISYNGGKIVAKGVGAEVRGGTYDYIIGDDILRSDNKLSDEDVESYIDEELEPMIFVRKGQIVIVGTPQSDNDIFSTIEDRVREGSTWTLNTYPAITNWERKQILCPDRFTWDQLMKIRQTQTAIKFDKEFMCITFSSGSQIFPAELRKAAKVAGQNWTLYSRAKEDDMRQWSYFMGVDCARAGTAGGDFTVVIVLAYNAVTQEKRIVWMWRKKGMKISQQVEQIAQISMNFNHPVILVERNNIGQDFVDMLVDNYNLNVQSFTTGARGQSKDDLIRYLLSAFENGKMIIPQGDKYSRETMEEVDRELERFVVEITAAGNEVMKGSGHRKDDIVMALALANRCSQSFGYIPFAVSIDSVKPSTSLEKFATNGDYRDVMKAPWY